MLVKLAMSIEILLTLSSLAVRTLDRLTERDFYKSYSKFNPEILKNISKSKLEIKKSSKSN